jgi:hypothetical protein
VSRRALAWSIAAKLDDAARKVHDMFLFVQEVSMSDTHTPITGSCLCGAVAFRIDGPLGPIAVCHCGMCRKQTGSNYPCTNAVREQVSFTASDGLKWYRSSEASRRGFCGACGSALFFEDLGVDRLWILAGALDDSSGLRIAEHIYVADKPNWYKIADDAPQYAGERDAARTSPGD